MFYGLLGRDTRKTRVQRGDLCGLVADHIEQCLDDLEAAGLHITMLAPFTSAEAPGFSKVLEKFCPV